MSLGKILGITAGLLLGLIGLALLYKTPSENSKSISIRPEPIQQEQAVSPVVHKVSLAPIEIALEPEVKAVPVVVMPKLEPKKPVVIEPEQEKPVAAKRSLPEADRIEELFNTTGKKLPFIETVTYKSRVAWQKGRPAWLSDYASYYGTSRHFIARSLNGSPDYFKQEIAEGNKFNVFKQDYPLEFHLAIDVSRCKMWLYAISGDKREKTLLKTYSVSLGRQDSSKESGLLTPIGKYKLGNRIAIYKPKVMGHYKGIKAEMIQVFGTRWIPFEVAMSDNSVPAKGLGLHGVPWVKNKKGDLEEDLSCLGKFESDGCVRMAAADVEEIYAIVITKPAYIELVKDITQSEIYTD
jgi:hypothetical protein